MKRSSYIALIAGLALVVAVALPAIVVLAQPQIPHTLEGRSACTTCHTVGGTGVGTPGGTGLPTSHQGRTDATCTGCHQAAPVAAQPTATTAPASPTAVPPTPAAQATAVPAPTTPAAAPATPTPTPRPAATPAPATPAPVTPTPAALPKAGGPPIAPLATGIGAIITILGVIVGRVLRRK